MCTQYDDQYDLQEACIRPNQIQVLLALHTTSTSRSKKYTVLRGMRRAGQGLSLSFSHMYLSWMISLVNVSSITHATWGPTCPRGRVQFERINDGFAGFSACNCERHRTNISPSAAIHLAPQRYNGLMPTALLISFCCLSSSGFISSPVYPEVSGPSRSCRCARSRIPSRARYRQT